MPDTSNPALVEMVSSRTLQKLQDTFAEALGISAQILDAEGKPITRGRWNSDFLHGLCRHDRPEAMRVLEHKRLHLYECGGSIHSFAAPIMVEGRVIGIIQGGQVRLNNPDLKMCKTRAQMYQVEFDQYLENYLRLPLFTKDRLEAAANLLRLMANTISSMAYASLTTEKQMKQVLYINDLLDAELKRKTQELELSLNRFNSLFQSSSRPRLVLDEKAVCIQVNPRMIELLGYSSVAEVEGKPFSEFIPMEMRETFSRDFKNCFQSCLAGEKSCEGQLCVFSSQNPSKLILLTREGTQVFTEISLSSLLSHDLCLATVRPLFSRKSGLEKEMTRHWYGS